MSHAQCSVTGKTPAVIAKEHSKRGVCGYRQVCGGCRARAYAATGNYMAEEPFCAYIPPQPVSEG